MLPSHHSLAPSAKTLGTTNLAQTRIPRESYYQRLESRAEKDVLHIRLDTQLYALRIRSFAPSRGILIQGNLANNESLRVPRRVVDWIHRADF